MSDQTFGKAARAYWDELEQADADRQLTQRAEVLARIELATRHVFPPIPDRRFDWSAVDRDTYDGEGSPIGWGRTEQDAIDDLLSQLTD